MNIQKMEGVLKAISDESRLKILCFLSVDTFCGCELVDILELSQPAVSQHLKKLREVNLTNEEKRGRWVYYSLNKQHELYPFILHLVSLLPPLEISSKRKTCN
ncbi:ArsR/SmtB family transcription factor [Bacillus niameyensis]|uniref:ArsR/SmtB family transcription factor n=1 Tax=Bacillus niameyensis TaxID=1522308 RepID=UPI000780221A|nr:metalloregulator ArsR/SmtB family transcription factor [Bacillus niameyensis]